ncbi:uncharacterized protein LOC112575407 isoform X2 [Pomacea canaliculata]|uniref:uncharacterized protein LOC112575407 isoform X2 n=1 Tax=Pomacea canaliculata TaxID=400727 RepID=UPI000D7313B1|nr:uncharacterized protein LOC112575407 isoform X2 [Pomacea canaliculata]
MGVKWLLEGHQVHIVCSSRESRVACTMLYRMLLQHQPEAFPDQLRFLQYNFFDVGTDVEKAVNDLSQAATEDSLYVISDDVELLGRVPGLHLWAASYFSKHPPDNWPEEYLTRPFRSPPAVVMQVEQDEKFRFNVKPYTQVELLQDNNDLETVYHPPQGHPALYPGDCETCGCQVATILLRLRESVSERTTASGTAQASLEWRDMLVLYGTNLTGIDRKDISGLINGLKNSGIPVEIMKDDNIKDVATACTDVVWVTNTRNVRGLERKVVVVVQESNFDIHNDRLYLMSRCSSKLVIVCPDKRL